MMNATTGIKKVSSGFVKLIASYFAVLFAIMLLPVFLITKDVSAFESIMNYIFNNKG